MKNNIINTLSTAVGLTALAIPLAAQTAQVPFVPFHDFVERTRSANIYQMTAPGTRVRDAAAFEEMRAHLMKLYDGVEVAHSYVIGSSHFDCIPAAQQPAARMRGVKAATPPPAALLRESPDAKQDGYGEGATRRAFATNAAGAVDAFGNPTTCEASAIPMRRLTLEEMSRHSSLREFFSKGVIGKPPLAKAVAAPASDPSAGHKYAAMTQSVANIGGGTTLNIWNPYVDQAQMSLMQMWVTGGSGDARQTAEVGWQVQPDQWGSNDTVLFIFYTADNYQSGLCYNLDCGVFYQVASDVALGTSLGAYYSAVGGTQWDIPVQYMLWNGDWWLQIGSEWVGYYPGSAYNGGAMSQQADTIMFGTESTGDSTGWPGEGSGNFAEAGYGAAAYQRNMFYTDPSGNGWYASSLQSFIPSPSCYDVSPQVLSDTSSADWQAYFYVGGKGGSACQ
jgi:hypothetical protein